MKATDASHCGGPCPKQSVLALVVMPFPVTAHPEVLSGDPLSAHEHSNNDVCCVIFALSKGWEQRQESFIETYVSLQTVPKPEVIESRRTEQPQRTGGSSRNQRDIPTAECVCVFFTATSLL